MSRRSLPAGAAAIALIAAGMVAVSGPALAADTATINGATRLGFQGTWTSSDAAPTAFTLNGTACSL
jgi:hypothetical protein